MHDTSHEPVGKLQTSDVPDFVSKAFFCVCLAFDDTRCVPILPTLLISHKKPVKMSAVIDDPKHDRSEDRSEDRASDAEDSEIRDFYGPAVKEAYRLKSELVAQHLAKIGMGKYYFLSSLLQIFVVDL